MVICINSYIQREFFIYVFLYITTSVLCLVYHSILFLTLKADKKNQNAPHFSIL